MDMGDGNGIHAFILQDFYSFSHDVCRSCINHQPIGNVKINVELERGNESGFYMMYFAAINCLQHNNSLSHNYI